MNRRVVITGYGIVTPIGSDLATFQKSLFAGTSGIRNIRGSYVPNHFPVPHAALVSTEELSKQIAPLKHLIGEFENEANARFWQMALCATRQATISLTPQTEVDAVVYGTGEGVSFEVVSESLRILKKDHSLEKFNWRNARSDSSLQVLKYFLKSQDLAKNLQEHQLIAINSACASGNQALSIAFSRIRSGQWNRALAGGVDARCNPSSLLNFNMLSAVTTADVPSETASRPFDKTRSGFVRGEGAATLMLEDLESALARKAPILGEIVGSSNTSDAWRLTDGREDSLCVVEAMRLAIQDASLTLTDIDYINAHGTSTPLNDRLETQAIKKLFGERAYSIPVSSLKSQIGHPTVAAGAIEAVATLMMLQEQIAAPTINYREKDPDCDLDYVPNESRPVKMTYALSNSLGFGGQNSCVVLKRYTG